MANKLDAVMWNLYQQMCLVCYSVEYMCSISYTTFTL